MSETFGYIFVREETEEQAQLAILRKLSIPEKNIYIDRRDSASVDRRKYEQMKKRLNENDLLYIKSLDWLGESYAEIMEQWRLLTHDRHVDVAVLDLPIIDTRRDKEFPGDFLSETVTELLSYIANNEHTVRKEKLHEGIAKAKARGIQFGRPRIPLPRNFDTVYEEWSAGEITGVEAAQKCGMPLSTFRYKAGIYKEEIQK